VKEDLTEVVSLLCENNSAYNNSEIEFFFFKIQHKIQCQNFIAVGSLIENFFGQQSKYFNEVTDAILTLSKYNTINSQDIRHG